MNSPLLIEATRGSIAESVHRVHVAVRGADGRRVLQYGDAARLGYPRSAIKPLQCMATIESGAIDAFGLNEEHIALHCASHNAEPTHVEAVGAWMTRIGLVEADLECGPQTPYWAMLDMQRAHEAPPPRLLGNNCSGKHAGFLTAARHAGGATRGYVEPQHPVQRAVTQLIADMAGVPPQSFVSATEMCRAPVHALPLDAFALALARLAQPQDLPSARADAAARVVQAMRAHPWLVAGSKRADTLLMQDPCIDGIAKCGAEGCYAIALPEAGLGIAIKVEDGADRAASVAAAAVLAELGILDSRALDRLQPVAKPLIRNWAGETVGELRAQHSRPGR